MNLAKSPKYMASTRSVNKSMATPRYGSAAVKSLTFSCLEQWLMARFFAFMEA